ncbi:hypothetical protein PZ897_10265 [Hoeflea sp. YIM 152468]|uniref:hypothetical protein n=1 Tax=Hoeflea sp. YIM 152468 TaxID=3031759 RepID=UPI0023DBD857|nr:hypothetical protein [Hoeflea sp. YIM 152468]MDF1608559.1 hypothetical protein [Hoeflea sp. YIM 152468]
MSQILLRFAPVMLCAGLIAGCTSADPRAVLNPGASNQQAPIDPVTGSEVVQGACPAVTLREGTAYYTSYAKGGDGDASKVIYQSSIADTTRQCRISGDQMTVTVVISGRVVTGPAAKSGEVNLPIRVAVLEGENVLYSELQTQPVAVTAGGPAAQFIFTNATVSFPASASASAKLYAGFDPGPYNTP